jgi:hypothetical protein
MSKEQRKTINAKEAVNDVRSGMTDLALMEKYGLSRNGLQSLLRKLAEASLLEERELATRTASSGPRSAPIAWKCPACGAPQTRTYDECPNCGVIVAKFQGKPAEFAEPDDGPPEPRKLYKQEWIMLLVGPGVALICMAIFWFNWILGTFRTLVHEMGHAIFGWAFGYPSLPAFDFLWGGGVTLHIDRSKALLILIYIGFAALIYLYRKNTATTIFLVVVAVSHAIFSYTDFHSVIILFMGHGTELIIGGLFIYRSLSGRAIVHPAERPLYAVIGFFLIFSDIALGFSLLTSPDARAEYLSAKGGDIDMDFIRIARDHLRVKMSSVVLFFFFCSVIAPVLSFLAFRYEEYIHTVIAALWRRGPAEKARDAPHAARIR